MTCQHCRDSAFRCRNCQAALPACACGSFMLKPCRRRKAGRKVWMQSADEQIGGTPAKSKYAASVSGKSWQWNRRKAAAK